MITSAKVLKELACVGVRADGDEGRGKVNAGSDANGDTLTEVELVSDVANICAGDGARTEDITKNSVTIE